MDNEMCFTVRWAEIETGWRYVVCVTLDGVLLRNLTLSGDGVTRDEALMKALLALTAINGVVIDVAIAAVGD